MVDVAADVAVGGGGVEVGGTVAVAVGVGDGVLVAVGVGVGGNFSTRKNGSPPVRHSSAVQMAPGRVMEYVLLMGVTAVSTPS